MPNDLTQIKTSWTAANITLALMMGSALVGGGIAYSNITNTDVRQTDRMDQIDRDRANNRTLMNASIDEQHRQLNQLRTDMQDQLTKLRADTAQAQTAITQTNSGLNDRLTRIETKLEFLVQASTKDSQQPDRRR